MHNLPRQAGIFPAQSAKHSRERFRIQPAKKKFAVASHDAIDKLHAIKTAQANQSLTFPANTVSSRSVGKIQGLRPKTFPTRKRTNYELRKGYIALALPQLAGQNKLPILLDSIPLVTNS